MTALRNGGAFVLTALLESNSFAIERTDIDGTNRCTLDTDSMTRIRRERIGTHDCSVESD